MKRVPKTVKIGCHDYEVVQQKKVIAEDGTACDALIQPSLLNITVARGLKRQMKQESLLHEAIHGLFDGYPFDDDEDEERLVTYLAKPLLQLIRDNPEFVFWLQQR